MYQCFFSLTFHCDFSIALYSRSDLILSKCLQFLVLIATSHQKWHKFRGIYNADWFNFFGRFLILGIFNLLNWNFQGVGGHCEALLHINTIHSLWVHNFNLYSFSSSELVNSKVNYLQVAWFGWQTQVFHDLPNNFQSDRVQYCNYFKTGKGKIEFMKWNKNQIRIIFI